MLATQLDQIEEFYNSYVFNVSFNEKYADYRFEQIPESAYIVNIHRAFDIIKEFFDNHYNTQPTEFECFEGITFIEETYKSKNISYMIMGKFLDEFVTSYRLHIKFTQKVPDFKKKYVEKIKERQEELAQQEKERKLKEVAEQRKAMNNYNTLKRMRDSLDREYNDNNDYQYN